MKRDRVCWVANEPIRRLLRANSIFINMHALKKLTLFASHCCALAESNNRMQKKIAESRRSEYELSGNMLFFGRGTHKNAGSQAKVREQDNTRSSGKVTSERVNI